jgi:2'-5' RNA ligase
MASKRIFIAVDVPEEARGVVAEYIADLRSSFSEVRVGWERAEKLHFTLKFLGHVEEANVPKVQDAIAGMIHRYQPFTAELSGTGLFPNTREPRILWLGIGVCREEMIQLGKEIESAVERLGFAKEPRPFSPHLTIGRIRQPGKGRDLAAAHLSSVFPPIEFSVDHVTIYESILGPSGSCYEVISRHRLQFSE